MSSRSTVVFGSVCVAALAAGAILYLGRSSGTASSASTAGAATSNGAGNATASSGTELAQPPAAAPAASSTSGSPSGASDGRMPGSERAAVASSGTNPKPGMDAAGTGSETEEPLFTEAPKPGTLDPVTGGEGAIRAKFAGSSYETRHTRLQILQAALQFGEPEDKTQSDDYQALKDELYWLRDNLGEPPQAPKK